MSETKLPKISEDDAEKPPQKDAQIKRDRKREERESINRIRKNEI